MYIEELQIDRYLQEVQAYEQQEDNEEPYPEMPEVAAMYEERGELFLGDEDEEVIAPDILGFI